MKKARFGTKVISDFRVNGPTTSSGGGGSSSPMKQKKDSPRKKETVEQSHFAYNPNEEKEKSAKGEKKRNVYLQFRGHKRYFIATVVFL